MELFDKRFVYFMWDDKLEGQKGFVANYINDLKLAVNQGYWTKYGTLHKGSDAYPFRTIVDERWCLCYCDPNYEIKKAFNEGKNVQMKVDGFWANCDKPDFEDGEEYRVKPEERAVVAKPEKQYRPYESSAEMIADFIDRFNVKCPSHCEPLIWVKGKWTDNRYLVLAFHENAIKFSDDDEPLEFEPLFNSYTYLDGSPVGMEVKE